LTQLAGDGLAAKGRGPVRDRLKRVRDKVRGNKEEADRGRDKQEA
jgi:hypothetical protein